ncbi:MULTISPECIES: SDR family oxidoreductase [Carnobacterium]|uniref:SDR family oxidoreductase n=1 Tax=Carnobacterium antarcticum TaxID=2126436 RepID=A0ABW4NPN5_9LACT|nr:MULTISPECIES: SDR family oxidoreductase [unclassified Carnobacterium]ALV22535.1 short chain dehydrogenase [Carnobacterium sp. CP1]QQP70454.1 SDR family oxidoreductase [Carnobacterium sp. CS13]
MVQETFLITGAGTGFGKGIALGLAEQGEKVIAGVETMSEVSALENEAKERKIDIQVEKLDVTDPADRERAWTWDVDVLLNNAGISEGGSLADIPEERLRNQFEVNVFGPILLTQKIAKAMVKKQRGKIVFMSSVSGLMADPLSGPYGGSKFTLEAFAESLSKELQEFNVQVAVINPGPYLTGFNDREFEAWRTWRDNPAERLFDYEQLAFPYEQLDPEELIKEGIKVITGETNDYRNVVPKAMSAMIKKRQKELWDKKSDENLGERHELVQKSIDIEPATTPVKGIVNKIKDKL